VPQLTEDDRANIATTLKTYDRYVSLLVQYRDEVRATVRKDFRDGLPGTPTRAEIMISIASDKAMAYCSAADLCTLLTPE